MDHFSKEELKPTIVNIYLVDMIFRYFRVKHAVLTLLSHYMQLYDA